MAKRFIDHDRFVRKNTMLAQAYDVQKKDIKTEQNKGVQASCYNCKFKNHCQTFSKATSNKSGSVSFGGSDNENFTFICQRYELVKQTQVAMTDKQIKSLLKNAMNSR